MEANLFLFTRKQSEVVVGIEHRKELLAILVAYYIYTNH